MHDESTPLRPRPAPPPAASSIRNILFSCLPMVALTAADGALVLAAYPTLGSKFHHLDDVAWCMISYQIGVILGQSIYSRLSDKIGRKKVMLGAHGIFIIGVICQSFAPDFWFIVGARAITGLGTAGMPLMVNTILNDISGEETRGVWLALVQTATALGQFFGGVCGGYILEKVGWQAVSICELCYAVLSFVLVWWSLSPPTHDLLPTPFNIPSAVALTLCLWSLVSLLDTDHFGVGTPLFLIIVFVMALYLMETRAEASLVPWRRLGDKSMLYVLSLAPITAVTDMSILNLIPYYVQASEIGRVAAAGWLQLALTTAEIIALSLCSFFKRDRHVFMASRALACFSACIFSFGNDYVKTANLVLAGLSSGLANGTSITMIMRYTKRRGVETERCILYGAYHLVIAIGNLFANSVVLWILQYNAAREIRMRLGGDYPGGINKLVKECLQSFDYIDTLPDWMRARIRSSFLQAIQTCFVYIAVISALGATLSVLCGYGYPREEAVGDSVERQRHHGL
ncbi:major facilitator superfamily domain-containing protein [Aspergillus granulosus]|uniref:Major facilitator superfamily domain-containing protein n=1 Tax=Aspergillus granulosus TaxID=176169 RepID=A0ABR4H4V1_9EURO